jgi:type IV pilus assembly protein PilO
MADNPLTKLPLAGQVGASAALAAVIGAIFYFMYWQGADAEQNQKSAKLDDLQKQIRALEVTASRLEDFKREVAQLEAKLETLKRILPPQKETPDLLKKVQYLAAQSNLLIRRFTPGATTKKEFYEEWPINIDVDGTYHNLGLFFDRVSRLSRLVNVGNLKVKAQSKQSISNTIAASCVATTFVYVDTPVATAAPPPKK